MDRITNREIVDALTDIRDELAGDVPRASVVPSVWRLIGRIERAADLACEARMDALAAELASRMPPNSDASPEVDGPVPDTPGPCPADRGGSGESDAFGDLADYDGPTPDEVLASDAPTSEPSHAEWAEYFDLADPGLTEADHVAAHGCA